MSSTVFATGVNISSAWLNDVNAAVYGLPGVGSQIARGKSAITQRQNLVIAAADPHLQMSIGVATWNIESFIPVAAGAGGLAIGLSFTGTLGVAGISYIGFVNGVSNIFSVTTVLSNQIYGGPIAAAGDWISIRGFFQTTSSGTFAVQWCQNSSNAAFTSLLQGGSITLTRTV